MNRFKKFVAVPSTLFVVASFFAALFCVGCGDSGTYAGTSEETNEVAENESSSSIDEGVSSSSAEFEASSSSVSSGRLVISSGVEENMSSSSGQNKSSADFNSPSEVSSSSEFSDSRSTIIPSERKNGSLDYYLHLFALSDGKFDSNVMATAVVRDSDRDAEVNPPNANSHTASATEFDAVDQVHRFVKQNVAALKYLFPKASQEYVELAAAIADGSADENCGLYMLNVRGDENSAGHILAEITSHTATVLDIAADGCKQTTQNSLVRFLFAFCGEIDRDPEIKRITVNGNLSAKSCSALNDNSEWVK